MTKRTVAFAFALFALAFAAVADDQNACPCVALSYTWIVKSCDSWNCAAAALIMADGDPQVFVMPTRSDTHKWVVLRRVVSGSVTQSPDEPFLIEQFSSMSDGSARFAGLNQAVAPLLITPTDGNVLVVFLREAEQRRRPAAH